MITRVVSIAVLSALLFVATPSPSMAGPDLTSCGRWSSFSCIPGNVGFFGGAAIGAVAFAPVWGPVMGVEELAGADNDVSDAIMAVGGIGTGLLVAAGLAGPFFVVEGVLYQGPKALIELFANSAD